MPPHKTHKNGRGVDIRPIRKDGKAKSTNISHPSYSHELTKELFNLIADDGGCRIIYFNDKNIISSKRKQIPGHDNHLHVEIK